MYYYIANRWEVARAEEPDNFLTDSVPEFFLQAAPAPYYFPKQLRLRFIFQAAPGSKGPKTCGFAAPALDYWLSLVKYFFPKKLGTNVKLQEI